MSCEHESHDDEPQFPLEWPEGWDEEKRKQLQEEMQRIGQFSEEPMMMVMAQQIHKRGVGISDLITYLTEMREIGYAIAKTNTIQSVRLEGYRRLMQNISPSRDDSYLLAGIKLVFMLVMAPIVFLMTVPLRLYSWVRLKWLHRKFYPYFDDWIKAGKAGASIDQEKSV